MTLQRLLAIAGQNFVGFSNGFIYGQVACVVTALQNKEDGIDLSEGQISLIASALPLACTIGFIATAFVTDKLGRRLPFVIFSITMIVNWIVLYYANHLYQFIISRIIGGTAVGSLTVLNIFVTPEYTTSNSRAFYLNMVTTFATTIGSTFAHGIGVTVNWRHSTLFGIIPAIFGVVIPLCWVESPHWLASKGRFEECAQSFRKLHGSSLKAERELQLLIKMETKKLQICNENCKPTLNRLCKLLKRKYFWEPFILSMFLHIYLTASGKLVFTVLASVMVGDIIGSSDVIVYTLLVDVFLIIGACLSCFFIRKTSLRTLLFTTGCIANILLVIISALIYFKSGQRYVGWISLVLLSLYFITINAGPYPLIEALYGEIFPLQLKLYIFSISGFVLMLEFSLSIFLFSYIVNVVGYHGWFLINSAIMTFSLVCIWLMLPETKGKTLQEIEVYFKARTFDVDQVLNNEQAKVLI